VLVTEQPNTSIQNAVCKKLSEIKQWYSSHKLVMNECKTKFVQFYPSRENKEPTQITFNDLILHTSDSVKFLGLHIDSKLNWYQHIDNLCKKLAATTFALRFLKDKMQRESLIEVYYALFQSHLKYGIIFWGNSSKNNINPKESYQNSGGS
jgi:hypothetical protein